MIPVVVGLRLASCVAHKVKIPRRSGRHILAFQFGLVLCSKHCAGAPLATYFLVEAIRVSATETFGYVIVDVVNMVNP